MVAGGLFARRLAMAVAIFELLAGFGTGALEHASLWQTAFVIAAPFAIYGLLLPLAAPLFEFPTLRLAARGGFLLIAAIWFARHSIRPSSMDAAITLAAALLGGVLLVLPVRRADRPLRWLPPVAALIAAPALLLWMRAEGAPWRGLPPTAPPPSDAPNLVLISWDTVRADVLGIYGGTGVATPHLDRIAAEGVVYEDAVAQASITGPSHASMLTGRNPPAHGLRSNGAQGVAAEVPMVTEFLHDAGYRTGGFISAYPLLGKFGFARGFEHFDDRLPAQAAVRVTKLGRRNFLWLQGVSVLLPAAPEASLAGAEVNERAFAWLDGLDEQDADRPFFLFVHYYDAHGPFDPPDPWRTDALAVAAAARPAAVEPTAQDEMALYRGEIAQLDALLGELRARLEEEDPGLENTLVLLTADHGECFGEGGIVENHTASLYEATQRVPLVLRRPAAEGAGGRVRRTATHLDFVPTLLDAAGVMPPPLFAGPGVLLGSLTTPAPTGRPRRQVYMEAQQEHLGSERKIGWRTGTRKLVRWQGGREELWGFGRGETEGDDLRAQEEPVFALLHAALEEFLSRIDHAMGEFVELDATDAAALDALGYTGD
jgi:arylsulfatase A-like enzyme